MTALTRASGALATICLVAGCSWGGERAGGDPVPEQPTSIEVVSRPHFTGTLDVRVRTGRIAYTDDPCGSLDEDRVCDPSGDREYFVFGETGAARVVEARMDPADGNTEWTATVTFSRASAETLRYYRELARDSGAAVLVLDEAGEVLLMAPVTGIEGRRVSYHGLGKPDAWDLVERIVGA